jgi:Na+/H+ antiporter
MSALIVAVVLGCAVLAGGIVQKYARVPGPWVWVVIGAALSFVSVLHDVALPPSIVLYIFLPALLYWESLNSSFQLFRKDARSIALLSVGLVATTAAAVAGLGLIAGLALPVALVLGAILSPTDATALGAIDVRMPKRVATILRGESLLNDGTALALYTVAVAAVTAGGGIQPLSISLSFVYAVAVGVASGLLVGLLLYWLRRLAGKPALDDTISILSPFALYLPAQVLGASGVVAVVAGGLLIARLTPRVLTARSRNETYSFWRAATYVINGILFVLIGLQARAVVKVFVGDGWSAVLILAGASAVAVFVVRLLWVLIQAPAIRVLDRRPTQRARRVAWRTRLILAWGGFRGAVSLAAALSLPVETASGHPFPGREVIIAVTFVVIVVTLFAQGATLPIVIRESRARPDESERDEQRLALTDPLRVALENVDDDARDAHIPDEIREVVRAALTHDLERAEDPSAEADQRAMDKRRLMLRAVQRRRRELLRLRNKQQIDDSVMLEAQQALDYEELHLRQGDETN